MWLRTLLTVRQRLVCHGHPLWVLAPGTWAVLAQVRGFTAPPKITQMDSKYIMEAKRKYISMKSCITTEGWPFFLAVILHLIVMIQP